MTLAVTALVLLAAPAMALPCVAIADLFAPTAFARFATRAPISSAWRRPDTHAGEAHLFRTALREGTRGAPDFAGHYTIVPIGCGAGAVCPAFVDRLTGRVRFAPGLRVAASMAGEFEGGRADYDRLTYRRDSRLLVVLASPNEDMTRSGAHLFEWRGARLRLVRFVPQRALCGFAS